MSFDSGLALRALNFRKKVALAVTDDSARGAAAAAGMEDASFSPQKLHLQKSRQTGCLRRAT